MITDTQAVEFLDTLVRIPSYSGQEHWFNEYLVKWLQSQGFYAYVDDVGNAIGILGDGPRVGMFLGHADTVPGWIPVEVRDGALYGRGSVDAKGPLAAATIAFRRLGPQPGWRWVLVSAVEEEVPSSRGAHHIVRTWPSPAFCIVGEPSGPDAVTIGYKGCMTLEIKLRDPVRHGATPDPNAIERMVNLWLAIRRLAEAASGRGDSSSGEDRFGTVDARLCDIRTTGDGLEEGAIARVSFRLPLHWSPSDWLRALTPVLETYGARWAVMGNPVPAHREDNRSPLVRAFLHAIREDGMRPRLRVKTGTSDMNVVASYWRCPVVAYGPGEARLDHTPDEHLSLDDYLRSIRVLEKALAWLAMVGEREWGVA